MSETVKRCSADRDKRYRVSGRHVGRQRRRGRNSGTARHRHRSLLSGCRTPASVRAGRSLAAARRHIAGRREPSSRIGSRPNSGCPREAAWMRIWCVRPVSNSISSHEPHGPRPAFDSGARPAGLGMIGRHDFRLRLAEDFDQTILPSAVRRIGAALPRRPSKPFGPARASNCLRQLPRGAASCGKDDRPRGRPIEPVRNAEIDLIRPGVALLQNALSRDLQAVDARRGLRRQSRRFAHHQAWPLFVKDGESQVR